MEVSTIPLFRRNPNINCILLSEHRPSAGEAEKEALEKSLETAKAEAMNPSANQSPSVASSIHWMITGFTKNKWNPSLCGSVFAAGGG